MSFISDLADDQIQRYQQQITTLRGSLLGTATGNSLNKPADEASMKYFLQVGALRTQQLASQAVKQQISENQNKNYYAKIDEFNQQQNDLILEPRKEKILKYSDDHLSNQTYSDSLTGQDQLPIPGEDVIGHNGGLADNFNNNLAFATPDGKGNVKITYKSWINPDGTPNQNTYSTPDNPFTEKINAMLEEQRKQTPGSYKFFIEKLHGKSIDGSFFKKNLIVPGQTRADLPNRMVFPAYIINFNDSYAPSWADYKFIGRGEKVYVYEETTRTLSLEFYMMSDFSVDILANAITNYQNLTNKAATGKDNTKLDATSPSVSGNGQQTPPGNTLDPNGKAYDINKQPVTPDEILKEIRRLLPDWGNGTFPDNSFLRGEKTGFVSGQYSGTPEQIWARKTFLAQCCYAWYRKDGKMKEQPFIRVRIGDFLDVVAKVDSLDFTTEDFDMDLNPSVIGAQPMGVRVAMRMTIIHEDEPTSDYPHFYHRKDFDTNPNDNPYKAPDNLSETSLTLDSALDKNKNNSPVSFVSSLSSFGKSQVSFPTEIKGIQETLRAFGGSISNLQSGGTLTDLMKGEKIKEALKNALRLQDIARLVELEKVKDIKKSVIQLGAIMKPKPKNTTSLGNTAISDNFKSAPVEKQINTPSIGQSLFPQFKKQNSSGI